MRSWAPLRRQRYPSPVAPDLYHVEFRSSDDAVVDAELVRLEDDPQPMAVITETCRRYGVQARLMRGPEVVGWVRSDGAFAPGGTQLEPPAPE